MSVFIFLCVKKNSAISGVKTRARSSTALFLLSHSTLINPRRRYYTDWGGAYGLRTPCKTPAENRGSESASRYEMSARRTVRCPRVLTFTGYRYNDGIKMDPVEKRILLFVKRNPDESM